jgi:hypothetical protein
VVTSGSFELSLFYFLSPLSPLQIFFFFFFLCRPLPTSTVATASTSSLYKARPSLRQVAFFFFFFIILWSQREQ